MARAFGGRVLLRIEDHDRIRFRPEYESAIHEDLAWLGLHADAPFTRQSDRHSLYVDSLERLARMDLVYACACSRKTIEASSSPTLPPNGELRYPGTCRSAVVDGAREPSRRVRLERTAISFDDVRLGPTEQTPADQCGDLLVRDRHGHWTYQFAATVDDFDQGVDLVIRGEDLMSSTGRQIQLGSLLGRAESAEFLHHPLIIGQGGVKLSKSNHDTGLRELRAAGWSPERVLGEAASALGLSESAPRSLDAIVQIVRESVR